MKYLFTSSIFFLFQIFAFTQEHDSKALVTTFGEAVVFTVPDEIILDFGINTYSESLPEAKKENDEISKKAIAYLKQKGITDKHIQTQYLRVSIFQRRNETKKYNASQTINFCIKDLDRYEEILMGLLELGITTISNPQFRTTQLKLMKDEARKKAMKAAKDKAILLAESLDQSIGKAHNITEARFTTRNQNAYANVEEQAEQDLGGERSFALGQMEVRATVEVSFILE
jgi:uncharacterized protein YggE